VVNALKNIAIGLVVFIVADQLIDALITGSSTAENLITTLVPVKKNMRTKGIPKKDGSGKGRRVNKRRGGCKVARKVGCGQRRK